jgi:hypothetical protein
MFNDSKQKEPFVYVGKAVAKQAVTPARYEIALRYAITIPLKFDADHIGASSRERIDTRKRTPYEETRTISCKLEIHIKPKRRKLHRATSMRQSGGYPSSKDPE